MFAVIKTGGKQYKVAENQLVTVERLAGEPGSSVNLDDVLMVGEDGKAPQVGAPHLDGAQVGAEIVEHTRGPKIRVFKKKRRKNYRRTHGHRQDLTVLRVTDIVVGGESKSSGAAKSKPAQSKSQQKSATQKAASERSKAKSPTQKTRQASSKSAAEKKTASTQKKAAGTKQASGGKSASGGKTQGAKSQGTKSKSSTSGGSKSGGSGSKSS